MFTDPLDPAAEGSASGPMGVGSGRAGSRARAFDERSPFTRALGSVLSRIEAIELRIRAAEAERTALMAEAFDLAACESDRISVTPQGERAELAYRAVRAEVATCLHQSEPATERQLSHAFTLTRDYRAVFLAYSEGTISRQHTSVIVDAGAVIGSGDATPESPEVVVRRAGYEQAVLAYAAHETPTRLRPIARRLAEQYAQRSLDERHAEARTRRRVSVIDAEDGMADLHAHLPAVEAYAIRDRLTRLARQLGSVQPELEPGPRAEPRPGAVPGTEPRPGAEQTGSQHVEADPMASTTGDPRTRDEIRADVLTDLLLGDGGVCPQPSAQGRATACTEERTWPSIRARVQVILTEAHLAGSSNDGSRIDVEGRAGEPEIPEGELFAVAPAPPELLGYGPIDTASARRVAGEASHWETIHEHPGTGAVLSVDRYRPSEAMRRLLGARDQHCRFPGCRAPVHRCDIDHTVDAALGGATSTDNLAHLCRGHHTLKHHTGWRVKQDSGGVLRWTSPSGRVHLDRPDRLPSRVRFSAETAEPSASHPPPGAPF